MNKTALRFHKPANYCIHIQGMLDASWSDRLGGLSIRSEQKSDNSSVTMLSGPLMDQAALFGVLNALYNMHYPLLYVEYKAETSTVEDSA